MVTVDCGPDTECLEHIDHGNSTSLNCAITPIGNHDPIKGGHLVLFSLKVYIEFPSGTCALLPSATVPHGNTPIQAGEVRFSLTQYCAGGLLRWVFYGFRTVKSLMLTISGRAELQKLDEEPAVRRKKCLDLFPTLSETQLDIVDTQEI